MQIAPQTPAVGALANMPSGVLLVAVGCGVHAALRAAGRVAAVDPGLVVRASTARPAS
jgi:hypothetical protein